MAAANRPFGKTGTLPQGTPSEHELTKQSLIDGGLEFSIQTQVEDPTFDEAWNILSPFVPGASRDSCLGALKQCMMKNHKNEKSFDDSLFDALTVGLAAGPTSVQVLSKKRTNPSGYRRRMLVFDHLTWQEAGQDGWPYEFSIAIATQVTRNGDLDIPTSLGCATSSRRDHSCVVVRRKNQKKDGSGDFNGWNVVESLATVELKRRETSTRLIKSPIGDSFLIESPLGEPQFGALWQTIAYVISDVWACVARRSATVDGEIPREIPFALIACDEAKTIKADDMDRFVLGNVLIPNVCGESFSFNLMSSKKFGEKKRDDEDEDEEDVDEKKKDDVENVEKAAAAYIKVLSRGVVLGQSLRNRYVNARIHSLNGLELHMFGKPLQTSFALQYSPLTKNSKQASQGELWSGTISNFDEIETGIQATVYPDESMQFVDNFDRLAPDSPLFIKSVSTMIHKPLVRKEANRAALHTIIDNDLQGCVNTVLLAAECSLSKGTMLLMHNLQEEYSDLQPKEHSVSQLWNPFVGLVQNTILVLARMGIVHPDIRPGYDFTSNIMVNQAGSQMVLIDLDSLVLFQMYPQVAGSSKSPYLRKMGPMNAYGYVWWQCFVVAMAWKLQTPQAPGCASGLQLHYWNVFRRASRANVTEQDVLQMLNSISASAWFDPQTQEDEIRRTILVDFC